MEAKIRSPAATAITDGGAIALADGNSEAGGKPKGGKSQRRKGDRIEREIVDLHRQAGIHAERVPLSGATRYQGSSHDIDVMAFGRDEAPLCCEVKARANGEGFATISRWLADNDALFLRENNAEPVVVLPFRIWVRLASRAAK